MGEFAKLEEREVSLVFLSRLKAWLGTYDLPPPRLTLVRERVSRDLPAANGFEMSERGGKGERTRLTSFQFLLMCFSLDSC